MEDYRFKKEDFVPVLGFCKYYWRNYSNDFHECEEAEFRSYVLFFYNTALAFSSLLAYNYGLEKLLE